MAADLVDMFGTTWPDGDLSSTLWLGTGQAGDVAVAVVGNLAGGESNGEGYGSLDLSGWDVLAEAQVVVDTDQAMAGAGPIGTFDCRVITRPYIPGMVLSVGAPTYSFCQGWVFRDAGTPAAAIGSTRSDTIAFPAGAAGAGLLARVAYAPNELPWVGASDELPLYEEFFSGTGPAVNIGASSWGASGSWFPSTGEPYQGIASHTVVDRAGGVPALALPAPPVVQHPARTDRVDGWFAVQILLGGGRVSRLRNRQRDDLRNRQVGSRARSIRNRGYY